MSFCDFEGKRIIGLVHPNSSVECLIPSDLVSATRVRLSFDGQSWSDPLAFRPVKGKRMGRIKAGKVATLQNGPKWSGVWHLVLIVVLAPIAWLSREKKREKELSPNAELLHKGHEKKGKRALPGTRKRGAMEP
jgi:hypothetical protein